jgi:ribonuclease G
MARARNRDQVLKVLREALDEDRTKTYVVEISPLGLVEMTRQNVTDGVREILTKECPTCAGEGVVLSEETVALDVERRLRELVAERSQPQAFLIAVHPAVAGALLRAPGVPPVIELEQELGRHFHFEGSESLPIDHFEVMLEGSREEVEQRALPFQTGEEVLVTIEEPHMYNDDDAVAKVDGYVVTVAGAGRLIGEQRLVRIERVGRAAADASLVESPDGAEPAGEGDDDDRSARRRRRRGRGSRSHADAVAEGADQ